MKIHEYRHPFWLQQPHCIHVKVALCKTKVNLLSLNVEAEIRHCLSLIVSKLSTWAKNRQRLLIKYIQELKKSTYGFVSYMYITWYYKKIKRRNSWERINLKITRNWLIQVAAETISHTTVDILSLQREWLITIHTKILLTALVVLTSSCMSGLAPAARRSLTTLWWPPKLAVNSGVWPFYSECVSVLKERSSV